MKSSARLLSLLLTAQLLCLAPSVSPAGAVASVRVKATFTGEPTWHNYGSTYVDAQGRMQTINIPAPFFHTISINTTVYVALDGADIVIGKMQSRRVNGNTDLMVAAVAGDTATVKTLLGKNAMVNTRNISGSTALMGAAAAGHLETVKLLIEKGARVNDKNGSGCTALMLAARNGNEDVVNLLLGSRAKVNTADSERNTALMYAVCGEHADVAKTLIDKGAAVDYTSTAGVSPLALAASKENKKLVALLTKTASAAGRSS